MKILYLIILIAFGSELFAQGPDYVVLYNGDTVFCDIMEDKFAYKKKEHELEIFKRRRILVYNGFHGIIARVGSDSLYYLESNQIRNYYQHNDLAYKNPYRKTYHTHPRPKGHYRTFDLGVKKNHNSGSYTFRYIIAYPANEYLLEYPIKHNSPFQLYICWLSHEEADWLKCFILYDGKTTYFMSHNRHLRKIGESLGINPLLWRKGGGFFTQKVLRFQYALNNLSNNK